MTVVTAAMQTSNRPNDPQQLINLGGRCCSGEWSQAGADFIETIWEMQLSESRRRTIVPEHVSKKVWSYFATGLYNRMFIKTK